MSERTADPESRLVGTDRVLAVLAVPAGHPDGIGREETARAVARPQPTVHRALAPLRRASCASQDGYGRYVLGTPSGVGLGHEPQVWLPPGAVMELGIDRLGTARQHVIGLR